MTRDDGLVLDAQGPLQAAREDHAAVVKLTRELVRIPSRGGIDPYDPVLDYMASWLAEHDLPCRRLTGAGGTTIALTCEVTGADSGPRYVLDACLDTAPFGDEKAWAYIPMDRLEVEFSTQRGTAYKFWLNELGSDDGNPLLELAYAVTIHKSQGSEFGKTFVVLPNPCRVLSRELLYTALTRQRDHVTVLMQGDLTDLKAYSSVTYSETAARLTNLFNAPSPVEVDGRFLEAGLIHKTRKGIAVRSKSEVIIADLLFSKQIEFQYERPLIASDGSWRSPDFTIDDDTTGRTIYWEHLGMLQRPSYRRKWAAKLGWYKSHGVLLYEQGGGPNGTLVTTEDGEDGSISSADIEALVDTLLG